jgi:hypothetical protein
MIFNCIKRPSSLVLFNLIQKVSMITPLPKKESKKQPVPLYALSLCVFFTFWMVAAVRDSPFGQGIAGHVSNIGKRKTSQIPYKILSRETLPKTTTITFPSYANIFSTAEFEDAKQTLVRVNSVRAEAAHEKYQRHRQLSLSR